MSLTQVPTNMLGTGAVLQVVQASTNSASSTSSTAAVTTGFSASITPKFSTSKILITIGGNIDTGASATQAEFFIARGVTGLNVSGFTMGYSATGRMQSPMFISYLDSPATTSSTTYTLYFAISSGSGTIYYNNGSGIGPNVGTITLTEIAG